jgi:hypothetical protein
MEILNDRLIINAKRSEEIAFIATFDSQVLLLSDFDSIRSEVKEIMDVKVKALVEPEITFVGNDITFLIPGRHAEKLPSKVFFDVKGVTGSEVVVLLEGEINIEPTVTKIF